MEIARKGLRAAAAVLAACIAGVAGGQTGTVAGAVSDAREPERGALLLDLVVVWLASNFELPARFEVPELVFVSPEQLAELRYGPDARSEPGEVVAVYSDDEVAIYLDRDWDGRTPEGLSVVVHEMVHHLQNAGGMRFACPGEREVLAYEAQDKFLRLFGGSLHDAFDIDATTLMLRTTCAY